ncbi:unnamed protein product [Pseudo-nitzschia multistriata]|uniref:Uncharacterized protein n=1 Tax=Pseudo-nitzschia multistriata TaxID=183589 RepID=A0A448ZSQ1_9STRA|nr:unnamed protein product [Pseudo-nitzschia multistriata]
MRDSSGLRSPKGGAQWFPDESIVLVASTFRQDIGTIDRDFSAISRIQEERLKCVPRMLYGSRGGVSFQLVCLVVRSIPKVCRIVPDHPRCGQCNREQLGRRHPILVGVVPHIDSGALGIVVFPDSRIRHQRCLDEQISLFHWFDPIF